MKIKLLLSILLLSLLGLGSSYARPLENDIEAYLDHPVRGPMEIALLRDGKMLADISIHGSVNDIVGWVVQKKFITCENFEEAIPHLQVIGNGVPLKVTKFTCKPY